MIKMYLKIQSIFTRSNEFLPDMSGGRQSFVKTTVDLCVADLGFF